MLLAELCNVDSVKEKENTCLEHSSSKQHMQNLDKRESKHHVDTGVCNDKILRWSKSLKCFLGIFLFE